MIFLFFVILSVNKQQTLSLSLSHKYMNPDFKPGVPVPNNTSLTKYLSPPSSLNAGLDKLTAPICK